jgi:hypothetical protein
MKFFAQGTKFNRHAKQEDNNLEKRMNGDAADAVEKKLFTSDFSDRDLFNEFNSDQMILLDLNALFEAGKIDLFHRDNCYQETEVLTTDHGTVLVIPRHVTYKNFREAIDHLLTD